MPTWGEILREVEETARKRGQQGPDRDGIRLKYLQRLHRLNNRAVIAYSSGWLNYDQAVPALGVDGTDVHAMMRSVTG